MKMPPSSLPHDFSDRLSDKKEALIQVLLDAEEQWIHGDELRQRMRDEYGLSVPNKSGAISSHQGHFTRWYSKDFSRKIIDVRWAGKARHHAEYRVGEYEEELREYFKK
jgi:hypothetical protein